MSGYTHGIPTSVQIANFWDNAMPLPWSGCWIWMGRTSSRGYGELGSGLRAHRVAYELENGAIPEGKIICHKCDVPLCVNPHHLFAGTWADNVHDMIEKGRHIFRGRPRTSESPIGKTVGNWFVTEKKEYRDNLKLFLWCKCSCGTERFVYEYDLRAGKSKGCGHASP